MINFPLILKPHYLSHRDPHSTPAATRSADGRVPLHGQQESEKATPSIQILINPGTVARPRPPLDTPPSPACVHTLTLRFRNPSSSLFGPSVLLLLLLLPQTRLSFHMSALLAAMQHTLHTASCAAPHGHLRAAKDISCIC